MSKGQGKSKFFLLKKYIRKWHKILGLSHYKIDFTKMVDNEESDISYIVASMCVVEAQNTVYCRIYPIADQQSDEDLWMIAAHEVIHVSVDKYVGYVRRRFSDLEVPLGMEEEVRLESVVDYLSKQLVKMLPLNEAYGSDKIEDKEEGGDVFDYSGLKYETHFGGNTN